jgi:hypothetical protein
MIVPVVKENYFTERGERNEKRYVPHVYAL